jgi:O-6-methylguanine DNA methyltransferase
MQKILYIARFERALSKPLPINIAMNSAAIVALDFNSSSKTFTTSLLDRFGTGTQLLDADARAIERLNALFDNYFSGKRTSFKSVKVDLFGTPFELRVCEELRKIPFGKVISYAELARRAGSPGGARAAAGALAKNPVPLIVPCHRIIRASGTLGGYSAGGKGRGRGGSGKLRGVELKRALLELEGVSF